MSTLSLSLSLVLFHAHFIHHVSRHTQSLPLIVCLNQALTEAQNVSLFRAHTMFTQNIITCSF